MINDPRLTESALCRREDPELWFPKNKGRKPKKPPRAVVICHSCPIQKECLQYALDEGERYGIWGGLDEAERRQLTRPAKPRTSRPGGCRSPARCAGCPGTPPMPVTALTPTACAC